MRVLYAALLRSCRTRRTLVQIHGHLLVTGLHRDLLHSTMLVESYANVGCIGASRLLFDGFPSPDSFMWSTMIRCYAATQLYQESISLYHAMQYHHQLTSFVFSPVLKACCGLHSVAMGRKVHGRIIKSGFEPDVVLGTSLLHMYGDVGCLEDARFLFDEMPVRDVVSWSSLISSYIHSGDIEKGLEIFSRMVLEKVKIDFVVLMKVAEACAGSGSLKQLKSVHGYFISSSWTHTDTDRRKMENCLMLMYGKCSDFDAAEKLFKGASEKGVIAWTCMISCYNQRSCHREALEAFIQMRRSGIELNSVTTVVVLHSCTHLRCLKEGQSIHGFMIKRCIDSEHMDCIAPALLNMYASFKELRLCRNVFETTQDKTVVSWNSVIAAYAQNGSSKIALEFFVQMRKEGFFPDSFTLSSTLPACGHISDLCTGAQIHGYIFRAGFQLSDFVRNSLLDMYCKCGSTDTAYNIFTELEVKDIVAWNVMISGFARNGKSAEAIALYDQIHLKGLQADHVTFLIAIQACSHLGSLTKGRWIHHKVIVSGVAINTYLDTALINMYAKCGDLGMARRMFDNLQEKSVVSWSSIISAYGAHGQIEDAFLLFSQMVTSGTRPNRITFMSILYACSHAGLVKEAMQYYDLMGEFQIEPELEHCACIVDLLSRAGYIHRAFNLIESMPAEPNASIWRALLNGCYIHQRTDIAEAIQKRILKNPNL